mmetsp:Transcript_44574/g.144777  ORF Transcript_44574/g.144777 Transcript_44574/m.144777 type:complete len:313 (+) Transcript_44574:3-941(+)
MRKCPGTKTKRCGATPGGALAGQGAAGHSPHDQAHRALMVLSRTNTTQRRTKNNSRRGATTPVTDDPASMLRVPSSGSWLSRAAVSQLYLLSREYHTHHASLRVEARGGRGSVAWRSTGRRRVAARGGVRYVPGRGGAGAVSAAPDEHQIADQHPPVLLLPLRHRDRPAVLSLLRLCALSRRLSRPRRAGGQLQPRVGRVGVKADGGRGVDLRVGEGALRVLERSDVMLQPLREVLSVHTEQLLDDVRDRVRVARAGLRRVRAAVGVEEGRGAHRDDKGLHEEDLSHCVLEVRGAMFVVLLCYLEHREVVED